MGLNDKKKLAEMFLADKESIVPYLAKKNWNFVCNAFNNMEVMKEFHEENYVDEDTLALEMDFGFSFSEEIDGQKVELDYTELLPEVKKISQEDYEYLAPVLSGGVKAEVVETVEKKMFKDGYCYWQIKKTDILVEIEKSLKELAGSDAFIEILCGGSSHGDRGKNAKPFGEKIYEPLISKGDRPSYKFEAVLKVHRL